MVFILAKIDFKTLQNIKSYKKVNRRKPHYKAIYGILLKVVKSPSFNSSPVTQTISRIREAACRATSRIFIFLKPGLVRYLSVIVRHTFVGQIGGAFSNLPYPVNRHQQAHFSSSLRSPAPTR